MILLISPKNKYATNRLVEEAGKFNMPITAMDVKELSARNFEMDINPYNVLYIRFPYPYFEQVIKLAQKFIQVGKRVVDASIAEGDADHNKWDMYQALKAAGVDIPRTEMLTTSLSRLNRDISPQKERKLQTATPVTPSLFQREGRGEFRYPFIVKWVYGIKGRNVYFVENEIRLQKILKKHPQNELLIQEYIDSEWEYKVMTVGYKSLPVILKFAINPHSKRPDFGKVHLIKTPTTPSRKVGTPLLRQEGRTASASFSPPAKEEYPPQVGEVVRLAEFASKATKRELAKVDIAQKGNELYVLEVNRWPGFQSFEKLTGYNVAGEFVRYLAK
jgi:glutathione synthase/RimK-type ligase-like ATP-grasp enzyme